MEGDGHAQGWIIVVYGRSSVAGRSFARLQCHLTPRRNFRCASCAGDPIGRRSLPN